MKSTLFSLVLISFMLLKSNAQESVSNHIIEKDKIGTHYLVEDNKLIRLNLISIKVFDLKKLSLLKVISLENLPKNWIPIDLIKFQGKTLLFYKSTPENNQISGYYLLYCQEIDIELGKISKPPQLITGLPQEFLSEISNERKYVYYPKSSSVLSYSFPFIKIQTSQSQDKLLISNAARHGIIFNSNLEPIHRFDVADFSDKKNLITIAETIDNQGNYYAVAKLYEFEDEFNYTFGQNFSNYNYNLVFLQSNLKGETIFEKVDGLEGKLITCATLKEIKNGELVCIGAYGNNEKSEEFEHGIFTFNISKRDDLKKFPFSFSNDFRKDDMLKNQKEIKVLLNSINLFNNEDGDLLAIGERVALDENSNFGGYVSYQDIIFIKFDQNLNKFWLNRLPKNVSYTTTNQGGGSYKYCYLNNSHFVFFLDNNKNFSKDLKQRPTPCKSSKNASLATYQITETGKVSKKYLYSDFPLTKSFQTHTITPISSTHIIFETYISNSKSVLTKISP